DETKARQILAGMVVGVGELRNLEVQRPGFLAFVDRRVEIDEMPARLTGRLEKDLDVALAVERAGVADVVVVVDDRVDVGGRGPAHALEMNLERGAGRPTPDVERKRARRDPMLRDLFASTEVDPEAV